jgi:fucose 4-O-acetylase-like acetyltransferase
MLRPGWLVAFCAAVVAVSAWLPWLSTSADGGGRASAIGGTIGNLVLPPRFGAGQLIVLLASVLVVAGAMAARGLSERTASIAAVAVSLLIVGMTVWYYRINVHAPVEAAYGLYVGGGVAVAALLCSMWALLAAMSRGSR